MNSLLRLFFFFIITIFWYTGLFWYSLPLLFWYSYKCIPYELFLIGFLIDIQFMSPQLLPMYTLFALVWITLIIWLKPKFLFHTETL